MELSNGMIGQYGNPMDENTEEISSSFLDWEGISFYKVRGCVCVCVCASMGAFAHLTYFRIVLEFT